MINVKIEKENAKYKKITVLGHAMYDDYGKDIVCAAVSSIATTTVNGILALNKNSLSYMVSKKGLSIDIKNTDVFNFRYILAESLPGRFTPVSAGNYIADTVLNLIKGDSYG